jgi:hypothetical protein
MAYTQKPDFVFRQNGRVHLNRRGCQFSWLLAVEVCASVVVMLDAPCSEVVWEYWLLPLLCVTVCHQVLNIFYLSLSRTFIIYCCKIQFNVIFLFPSLVMCGDFLRGLKVKGFWDDVLCNLVDWWQHNRSLLCPLFGRHFRLFLQIGEACRRVTVMFVFIARLTSNATA